MDLIRKKCQMTLDVHSAADYHSKAVMVGCLYHPYPSRLAVTLKINQTKSFLNEPASAGSPESSPHLNESKRIFRPSGFGQSVLKVRVAAPICSIAQAPWVGPCAGSGTACWDKAKGQFKICMGFIHDD